MNRHVRVLIARLLVRQLDVQAHGFAAGLRRALVGRLHDAGPAARHHGEVVFGETLGDFHGGAVIFIRRFGAGRAEDGDGGADVRHGLEGIHELRHDAEDAPGILVDKRVAVAHGDTLDPTGGGDKREKRGIQLLNLPTND